MKTKRFKVEFYVIADLNNDGNVDAVDLALLGDNWLNNKANGDYVLGDTDNFHTFIIGSENSLSVQFLINLILL